MGWLRKKAKQIGNAFKKVGKVLKKGLGKLAKAFGKLGPLGSLALSFIIPGVGGQIFQWLKDIPFVGKIFQGIAKVGTMVKNGVGTVFKSVTGVIEKGLNGIGNVFSKGSNIGTGLKNWVSEVINGKETVIDGETITEATGEVVGEAAGKVTEEVTGKVTEEVTGKVTEEVVGEAASKKVAERGVGDSFVSNLKDSEIGLKDAITRSREYATYKKIQPIVKAGEALNQVEEQEAIDNARMAEYKSDYFKSQADYQLAPLEQQNFSKSSEQPQFVNFADFNPQQDPAAQYLAYRGIQGNVSPVDVGGYGFDYETFLRAQLGGRGYA